MKVNYRARSKWERDFFELLKKRFDCCKIVFRSLDFIRMQSLYKSMGKLLFCIFVASFALFFTPRSASAQTPDVNYESDTLPTLATLSWNQLCNETVCLAGTSAAASGGILTITDDTINDFLAFTRSETSFSSANNILIDFKMRIVSTDPGTGSDTTVVMAIQDGSKLNAVSFSPSQIILTGGAGNVTAPFDTTVFHTYRLVKHRDVEVALCVDNSPIPLLTSPYGGPTYNAKQIGFGSSSTPGKSTSEWDFVRYATVAPTAAVNGTGSPVIYDANDHPTVSTQPWGQSLEELGCSLNRASNGGGTLTITDDSASDNLFFSRNEPSFLPSDNAVMESRMKVVSLDEINPVPIGFSMVDGNKLMAVGFLGDAVVLTGTGILASFAMDTTDQFHTYRLVKNGTTDVQLFVDGSSVLSVPYSSLSSVSTKTFGFGAASGPRKAISEWDYVRYAINNQPPVANAGPDQTVVVKNPVSLNGSGSYDPDFDPITYLWSEDSGNPQTNVLSSHTVVSPSFTPQVVGTYQFNLVVNDGFASSAPDTVIITVQSPTQAIQALINTVESFNLQRGIENSLDAKLDAAQQALSDINQNNNQAAINSLQAFINAVNAQRGNKITNAQADILIAAAQAILTSLS